jgi:murein DD-endopeptidase MepM/ murein hydrolase activator NlpD
MDIDIDTYDEKIHVDWVDVLAYLGAKYGGNFSNYRESDMETFVKKIKSGKSVKLLTKDMEYFDYYSRAYGAVLNGFLGEYQIKVPAENDGGSDDSDISVWKKAYGLKAFSPIAEGFYYSDFDDFGESRSYGYSRRHLGHDMMTSVGTPVIAVESGTIEALGWNQYGGWRIGIRSLDNRRYYYYAHLRKDFPFQPDLKEGDLVTAGDVIGYMGRTGYSTTENVNNIDTTHLHFGMQLIFDESQKETDGGEIWIDVYPIVQLLARHRSAVTRDLDTKAYHRTYAFQDLSPQGAS